MSQPGFKVLWQDQTVGPQYCIWLHIAILSTCDLCFQHPIYHNMVTEGSMHTATLWASWLAFVENHKSIVVLEGSITLVGSAIKFNMVFSSMARSARPVCMGWRQNWCHLMEWVLWFHWLLTQTCLSGQTNRWLRLMVNGIDYTLEWSVCCNASSLWFSRSILRLSHMRWLT